MQVADVMWALARLRRPHADAFLERVLLPHSVALLPWFSPQQLSNSAWALATACVAPDDEWIEACLVASETAMQVGCCLKRSIKHSIKLLMVVMDDEWIEAHLVGPETATQVRSCRRAKP